MVCHFTGEPFQPSYRQPYRPAHMCSRAPSDGFEHVVGRPLCQFPSYFVDVIVSRLITPIKRTYRHPTQKTETCRLLPKRSDPDERRERIERIQRPTTVTRNRKCCALAGDPALLKYEHVRFSQNVARVNTVRLDEILARLRASTVSSRKDRGQCKRSNDSAECTQKIDLALVSGLSRSNSVNDIVERLYRPIVAQTTR